MVSYNDILYDEIQKDKELVSFFKKIYNYSERIYDDTNKQLEEQLNNIKMDYTELFYLISNLKEIGIVISESEEWFALEKRYSRGSASAEEINKCFFTAKFNGLHILHADYVYIEQMLIYKEEKRPERFICRTQLEYEDWIRQYKSVERVQKIFNRLLRIEKKQQKWWTNPLVNNLKTSNQLLEIKEILEEGINLKNKLEFLHGLSDEQMKMIRFLYFSFKEMCNDYYGKRTVIENELKQNEEQKLKHEDELYYKAFIKLIEDKANDINMKSIETKLAKILILNKLKNNENYIFDFSTKNHSKDEFEKVTDWFIGLKHKQTSNIINLFTENIDLILEEQKVLKK